MICKKCELTKKQFKAIKENDSKYKVLDDEFICRCDDLLLGNAIYCYRHGKRPSDIME